MDNLNGFRDEILGSLAEIRDDPWGRQALTIAEGIRSSGIAQEVGHHITASVALLSDDMRGALAAISHQLASQGATLREIERLLANPRTAAAGELLRRGTRALENGWLEEAVSDLTASLDTDPYNPYAHIQLGRARAQMEDPNGAVAQFQLASRYSANDHPATLAGALLLQSDVLDSLGHNQEARQARHQARVRVPRCPEVQLAVARADHDLDALNSAIELEPTVGIVAVALNVAGAEDASNRVVLSDDGTLARLRRIDRVVRMAHGIDSLSSWQYGDWVEVRQHLAHPDAPTADQLVGLSRFMTAVQEFRRAHTRMHGYDDPDRLWQVKWGKRAPEIASFVLDYQRPSIKQWRDADVGWPSLGEAIAAFDAASVQYEAAASQYYGRQRRGGLAKLFSDRTTTTMAEAKRDAALHHFQVVAREALSTIVAERRDLAQLWEDLSHPSVYPFFG